MLSLVYMANDVCASVCVILSITCADVFMTPHKCLKKFLWRTLEKEINMGLTIDRCI